MYISYLGTNDHGLGVAPSSREPLRIVTCSNVVPVKRLDRLTGALATITDLPIHWTHFGDGPLMDRMRARVAELPVNIQTDIRGEISNDGVLAEYARTPFHVLINVSESEGIPVSMMEANSFGIPIIGTDVGGVGEIVETGVNGILLPQLPTPEEIAKAIRAVARLDDDSYASLRRGAREVWETKFDATTNYPRFVSELLSSTQDERRSLTGSKR
ncbi:MAG: glycosyltransferase [Propionibacterium sp.]|nr:glycosyltransferase [Propionibacterium sp.]